MVDLGKYEPIATAPRDGTLAWVYSELVGEVLARHIEDSAWRGSDQFILPTHWRHATAEGNVLSVGERCSDPQHLLKSRQPVGGQLAIGARRR